MSLFTPKKIESGGFPRRFLSQLTIQSVAATRASTTTPTAAIGIATVVIIGRIGRRRIVFTHPVKIAVKTSTPKIAAITVVIATTTACRAIIYPNIAAAITANILKPTTAQATTVV